jgi:hypothetical protein
MEKARFCAIFLDFKTVLNIVWIRNQTFMVLWFPNTVRNDEDPDSKYRYAPHS